MSKPIASLLLVLVFTCITCVASPSGAQDQQQVSPEEALQAKIEIGRVEFHDPRLTSLRGTMSCATCHIHNAKYGGGDGRKKAVGPANNLERGTGRLGIRNVPSLYRCYGLEKRPADRDGRAANVKVNEGGKQVTLGLYEACLQAVTDPLVMALPNIQTMVNRVAAVPSLRRLSITAYGTEGFNEYRVRDCMVAYLKTIDSPNLPADRLAAGLPTNLPETALKGWPIFQRECMSCHKPEMEWQDYEYHNTGLATRSNNRDLLRALVTGNPADTFKTRTQTLVEVYKTAPYGFDGSVKTFHEIVMYFAAGGRYKVNGVDVIAPNIDPLIKAIKVTKQEYPYLESFVELGFQSEDFQEDPNLTPYTATK